MENRSSSVISRRKRSIGVNRSLKAAVEITCLPRLFPFFPFSLPFFPFFPFFFPVSKAQRSKVKIISRNHHLRHRLFLFRPSSPCPCLCLSCLFYLSSRFSSPFCPSSRRLRPEKEQVLQKSLPENKVSEVGEKEKVRRGRDGRESARNLQRETLSGF